MRTKEQQQRDILENKVAVWALSRGVHCKPCPQETDNFSFINTSCIYLHMKQKAVCK